MSAEGPAAQIAVNGEERPLPRDGSLLAVLREFDLEANAAVAVAVNERVVPRSQWPTLRLGAGDRVEIVRPMTGG